jgi:hypothetical protein
VSHLREQFLTVEKGAHQILKDKRVDILRKSLSGHAIIDNIINQYGFKNCDDTLHTFEGIVEFVDGHLRNLQSSAKMAADASASIMTSDAYVALEAEAQGCSPCPKETAKAARVKTNPKNKRRIERMASRLMAPPQPNLRRGSSSTAMYTERNTHTHTSSECKLIAADTTRFNTAMRNAKDSDHPPGGSTKVLGR